MRIKGLLLALGCLLAVALTLVVVRAGDAPRGTTVSEIDLPTGPSTSPATTAGPTPGGLPREGPSVVGGQGILIDEDDQDDDEGGDEGGDDDDGDTDEGDD